MFEKYRYLYYLLAVNFIGLIVQIIIAIWMFISLDKTYDTNPIIIFGALSSFIWLLISLVFFTWNTKLFFSFYNYKFLRPKDFKAVRIITVLGVGIPVIGSSFLFFNM